MIKMRYECKINSNHEFLRKFTLELVFTRTGATFFFGIYFISIFVLLFVVYILFFRTSYFFSYFEERRICTCCFFKAKKLIFSFYFSLRSLLFYTIACLMVSSSTKLLLSIN